MADIESIFGAAPSDGQAARAAEEASFPAGSPMPPEPPRDTSAGLESAGVPTTPMSNFANAVMTVFRTAYDHRASSLTTDRLNYCFRIHRARFSDDQLKKLREMFEGSDVADRICSRITSVKNRALRAILVELVNQAGEPLFHLEATPEPEDGGDALMKAVRGNMMEIAALLEDLANQGVTDENMPPEAQEHLRELIEGMQERRLDDIRNKVDEEARTRVARLEDKVWDILTEGGFDDEFMKFIDDFCVFGTAVMVGPVMRNVARNVVKKSGRKGVKTFRREVRCIPSFETVSPLDCYPAPGAVDVEDGPLCITVRYTGDELYRFAKSVSGADVSFGGWMGLVVNDILARHPHGGVKLNAYAFDPVRRVCEGNGFDDTNDCTFEGVRCFMPMRGSDLIDLGVVKNLDSSDIESAEWYRTESIVIDNRVVYICIHPDEMGVPVSKACCYTIPGSWWGGAIADMLSQCQAILDNTAKNILVNQSMTSSPMGYVSDIQRMADKSPNALKWRPGKIFSFTNGGSFGPGASTGAPMGVFDIPSTLGDSLNLWKHFQQQADLDSGLPAYSEGQSAGASGALRTAQGLNTFVENTMRGCKSLMTNIDKQGICRIARLTADWVLIYDKDQSLKGDVYVRSVGLIGRVLKVQRDAMRLQALAMCQNSEELKALIGAKGIVELFRPSLEGLDLNPDAILPSKAKIEEQEMIARVAQIVKAVSGVEAASPAGPEGGAGMPSGVSPVSEPAPGGVAERRGVA